jgi:uncharacterized caspase-like protein
MSRGVALYSVAVIATETLTGGRPRIMGRGSALIVGVGDPRRTGFSKLEGVYRDIEKMQALFSEYRSRGFDQVETLRDSQADADTILFKIANATAALGPGDMFVFYYSGHGASLPDGNGDERRDQTFVTPGRSLIDDELPPLWQAFVTDVRVVVITDSCHSASNVRAAEDLDAPLPTLSIGLDPPTSDSDAGTRGFIEGVTANMIHLAACNDDEESVAFPSGSVFTKHLLESLRSASDYDTLFRMTQDAVSDAVRNVTIRGRRVRQTVAMEAYGNSQALFRAQKPLLPSEPWPII